MVRVATRGRVDLVAAEHQHVGSRHVPPIAAAVVGSELERRLRESERHGIGGVPAVTGVAHIVDPDLVSRARAIDVRAVASVAVVVRVVVVINFSRRQCLHDARVRPLADDDGEQRLEAGVEQLARLVPTDHRQALDAQSRAPEQRKSSSSRALHRTSQPASDWQCRAVGLMHGVWRRLSGKRCRHRCRRF